MTPFIRRHVNGARQALRRGGPDGISWAYYHATCLLGGPAISARASKRRVYRELTKPRGSPEHAAYYERLILESIENVLKGWRSVPMTRT